MLRNKKNGKIYVGQTIRPIKERFAEHETGKSKYCRAIYNAIKKYGWENFEKDYYECPNEDLNFDEELLVSEMGTLSPDGYNLREGGGNIGKPSEDTKKKMSEAVTGEKNHNYGKIASEETKKKMSEAKKGDKNYLFGKTLSEETKQKLSEAQRGDKSHWYGKTHTEESRQKMSRAQLGKTHTEESKQKMSEAQLGEKTHKSKRVYQYDLEGNFIGSFGSNAEAARYIKQKDCSSINRCVHGKLKKTYGFRWSYEPPFAN